jgi:hypothetical protein
VGKIGQIRKAGGTTARANARLVEQEQQSLGFNAMDGEI